MARVHQQQADHRRDRVDRPDRPADAAALLANLNAHLVRYKTPRTFEWLSEPLRDEAGKVRRNALRKERLAGV